MEIGAFGFLIIMCGGILFTEKTKIGAKLFDKLCALLDLDIEAEWED